MTEISSKETNHHGVLRFFVTLLILIVWYVSTSACNIASKLFITESKPEMYVDCALTIFNLSMLQLIWGVFLGACFTGRITSVLDVCRLDRMVNDLPPGNIWLYPTKNTQVFSAVCHAVGGFSLNLCYLYSSVFIVQVLKSAEPVATLSLGVLILGEKPSVSLVCSVLTIITGVAAVCFRDSTISATPVCIAMLSNFVLPMRNVLSKQIMMATADNVNAPGKDSSSPADNQKLLEGGQAAEAKPIKKTKSDGNPAESFYLTSLFAAYYLMPFWLSVCIFDYRFLPRVLTHKALLFVLLSGFMHASYNLSSFGFLSRVSTPTTHAIANVFKRVFTIWTAIIFFGNTDSSLSPLSLAGLALSTCGLFWYGTLTASKKG